LQSLDLNGCVELTNVDALKELKALQTLDLSNCYWLTNLDALKELKALQTLNLSNCNGLTKDKGLTNLDALKELKALQRLDLSYCKVSVFLTARYPVAGLRRLDSGRPSVGREFSDSIAWKIGQAREYRAEIVAER
jgi:internalin A